MERANDLHRLKTRRNLASGFAAAEKLGNIEEYPKNW